MDNGTIYVLIALLLVYAPLLVAKINGKPGGGIWTFLTFCCCTLALVGIFFLGFILSLVLWLVAWAFAAAARSSVRRVAHEAATLRALEEQNQLLRRQQGLPERAPAETLRGWQKGP